jgi:hypothetical protein
MASHCGNICIYLHLGLKLVNPIPSLGMCMMPTYKSTHTYTTFIELLSKLPDDKTELSNFRMFFCTAM